MEKELPPGIHKGTCVNLDKPDKQAIKTFVRHVLGCQCPDEVFEKIIVWQQIVMNGGNLTDFMINIGDRLLVVVRRHHSREIPTTLDEIIDPWRSYRDQNDFNRLRYVIPVNTGEPTPQLINKIECIQDSDDRVYIHLVDDTKLPEIIS